jgi:hypothetical protein
MRRSGEVKEEEARKGKERAFGNSKKYPLNRLRNQDSLFLCVLSLPSLSFPQKRQKQATGATERKRERQLNHTRMSTTKGFRKLSEN